MRLQTILDTLGKCAQRAREEPQLDKGGRFVTEAERRAYLAAVADVRQALEHAAIPRPIRNRQARELAAQRKHTA